MVMTHVHGEVPSLPVHIQDMHILALHEDGLSWWTLRKVGDDIDETAHGTMKGTWWRFCTHVIALIMLKYDRARVRT